MRPRQGQKRRHAERNREKRCNSQPHALKTRIGPSRPHSRIHWVFHENQLVLELEIEHQNEHETRERQFKPPTLRRLAPMRRTFPHLTSCKASALRGAAPRAGRRSRSALPARARRPPP